jgi:hypothetical protein
MMNPMALLTLPASSLRDATHLHRHGGSPSGERRERRGVLWVLAGMAVIGGALLYLR